MSTLHREHHFEEEICEYLGNHGWIYSKDNETGYDCSLALYVPDLVEWLKETQPKSWGAIEKNHGEKAPKIVAERVRKQLDTLGTLALIRQGMEIADYKERIVLSQFKPAFGLNPMILQRYESNRLRVVRQVRHSVNNPNDALDLVFFLNGIPVATVELKSDFTQSVVDAMDQYRYDRDPLPKGRKSEPLLSFSSGAIVHFAVSQNEVQMTTHLKGIETQFLPFNKGDEGGAGNPVNPNGARTAYLWEEIWQKDRWLEIIGRYLISQRDEKKQIKTIIFPRYHQLDVTQKLLSDVYQKGSGEKYLIQHSAGSGKTNSIAWSSHFLADLHNDKNEKIFDSVIVVSDRHVLDSQLKEAIFSFERTVGVVATISGSSGSKSKELLTALEAGKKIIVCTIQTFPFALEAAKELTLTQGKRFAVIADEAHSSQTGEAASKLKKFLSAEEQQELSDGGEISTEDVVNVEIETNLENRGITYIAFTATPKAKTLELFGTRDDKGHPHSFHVYSMRQAIEEGFILDVLKNYTTYNMAFQLAYNDDKIDEETVEKTEAHKCLMKWVRLHPVNIAQRVQVVVEHFLANVQPLLGGKAKAMVVVSSRKEAVRWQKAITGYIARKRYPLGVLVAFSGEVDDVESFSEPVTENSKELNSDLRGRDIRKVFEEPFYSLLLVANKFQTGFDQPLLCGMYVDKKLSGIQAVQTLSRLNRAHLGKETTYILDFVNKPEEIQMAFKPYYGTAELTEITDPNIIFDLRSKLDSMGYYDDFEVDRVANVGRDSNAKQKDLIKAIEPVADRLLKRYKGAHEEKNIAQNRKDEARAKAADETLQAIILFKADMNSFCRLYSFLSQIFDYDATEVEKRYYFYKNLLPLLEFGRERSGIDLSKVKLTHYNLRDKGSQNISLQKNESIPLTPISALGTGLIRDKEKVNLEDLINKINGLFNGEISDQDQLAFVDNIRGKLAVNQTIGEQAKSNTKEQFSNSPDLKKAINDAIMDALDSFTAMSIQAMESEKVRDGLKDIILDQGQLYEDLRRNPSNHDQPSY